MRRHHFALALVLLALSGCARGCTSSRPPIHANPNMYNQPRYEPQAASAFFYNGAEMRPPVPGTVARGELRDHGPYWTGKDTGGAFDYFICEVAPHGGPPLHVHHHQHETLHAVKGRFKVKIGEQSFVIAPGGFAYLPAGEPHAFLHLTDEPGELIIVFAPSGGHKFFEELAPLARAGTRDRAAIAAVFENHDRRHPRTPPPRGATPSGSGDASPPWSRRPRAGWTGDQVSWRRPLPFDNTSI